MNTAVGVRFPLPSCVCCSNSEERPKGLLMDSDLYTVVHLSGVPPYQAVAILENMKARGELPQIGD